MIVDNIFKQGLQSVDNIFIVRYNRLVKPSSLLLNMLTKEKILHLAKKQDFVRSIEIANSFQVSRQYASRLIKELVTTKNLAKIGSASKTVYVLNDNKKSFSKFFPFKVFKTFVNKNLEEHIVLNKIELEAPFILQQKESVKNIFTYAFLEMLNNAIEHSRTQKIKIEVELKEKILMFTIDDFGIGVFRNVMQKRGLGSELAAIQDVLKGKVTTLPKLHSGQGIFFTSRAGEEFILDSFGYRLIVNNKINDIFLQEVKGSKMKRGTRAIFKISIESQKHLKEVFDKFANIDEESNFGFDKTEIKIKLYLRNGIHISRSQARRVLVGLEKFRVIVLDFDKVPMIGQAFADEIFRVFHTKYPKIKIETTNMNDAVKFMIDRVEREF